MALSLDQVRSLAPDARAIAAAEKLARSRSWQNTGCDQNIVWGECQGSALYQVRLDCGDWGFKCNCPSRKQPCKHVLGLLVRAIELPETFTPASPPEWVVDWQTRREARAKQRANKEQSLPKPKDEKTAARRKQQRLDRITDGIAQLELWLQDLVRNGLGQVVHQGPKLWEQQAARLVDAQVPGLAAYVRSMGDIPGSGQDWPHRLLAAMGKLSLLTQAWQNADKLDADLAAEVRQLVGLTVSQEERLARNDCQEDTWTCLGQWIEANDRVITRRSWLVGQNSGRVALVLHFSVGGQPFEPTIQPGFQQKAKLRFWPSSYPVRAEILEQLTTPERISELPRGVESIRALYGLYADALAKQPWLDRIFALVRNVVPLLDEEGSWMIRDANRDVCLLNGTDHWSLLAASGGMPVDVAGEWNGRQFKVLGFWSEGRFSPIRPMDP